MNVSYEYKVDGTNDPSSDLNTNKFFSRTARCLVNLSIKACIMFDFEFWTTGTDTCDGIPGSFALGSALPLGRLNALSAL